MYRYYKKYRNYNSRKMSKFERFQWVVTIMIFCILFVIYFAYKFLSNCIFEWPIRWDVHTCWKEQIAPSKEKAIEKASVFAPL